MRHNPNTVSEPQYSDTEANSSSSVPVLTNVIDITHINVILLLVLLLLLLLFPLLPLPLPFQKRLRANKIPARYSLFLLL